MIEIYFFEKQVFKNKFEVKMKNTKSRHDVYNHLAQCTEPVSANMIFEAVKNQGITLSTVYRTLATFVENNIINKMENNEGVALYYLHQDSHSHFLECTGCHKRVKIDYCPYHEIKEQIEKQSGFVLSDDHILYGVCDDCNKKQS